MSSVEQPNGGYRFAPGIPPYSAGVLADDDHLIIRTTLIRQTPWTAGFETIDRVLTSADRPSAALCAVELRCPTPHSFGGFGSFNDRYREALDSRGILHADGTNPVARTNVAPHGGTAGETELHAFSYTVPRSNPLGSGGAVGGAGGAARPSFVIAGAGDLADQSDLRPEAIVGGATPWAESGPARAAAVLDEMEARLGILGVGWSDTDSVVVYSVQEIGGVMESTVLPRLGPAARRGVHWYHARPPIEGLLFEMDNRGGVVEQRI
ncbi:MAG: RidA family protein [Actinomycetota bacterium]